MIVLSIKLVIHHFLGGKRWSLVIKSTAMGNVHLWGGEEISSMISLNNGLDDELLDHFG